MSGGISAANSHHQNGTGTLTSIAKGYRTREQRTRFKISIKRRLYNEI